MFERMIVVMVLAFNAMVPAMAVAGADSTAGKPLFKRGSVVHGAYVEHYNSTDDDRNISVTQFNTEMAYFVLDRVSVISNAYLMVARGHRSVPLKELDARRYGVGFAGFVRADVFEFKYHSIFVDAGVGMVFTNESFPPSGTVWNFTRRYGGGIAIKLEPDVRLIIGWRDMHISNGKGFGHPKNPAYDSNGLFAGLRFRL